MHCPGVEPVDVKGAANVMVFEGVTEPFQEPRFLRRAGVRVVMGKSQGT